MKRLLIVLGFGITLFLLKVVWDVGVGLIGDGENDEKNWVNSKKSVDLDWHRTDSFLPKGYVETKYDPFGKVFYELEEAKQVDDLVPVADFRIVNKSVIGYFDKGIVGNKIMFDGGLSKDYEGPVEVRFDVKNDGVFESYFSRNKLFNYVFSEAGVFDVKIQVLDNSGKINEKIKKVIIVENEGPKARVKISKNKFKVGEKIWISAFDSFHNQYPKNSLKFRVDFDGDGDFENKFGTSNQWSFEVLKAGEFKGIVEVQDVEGVISRAEFVYFVKENKVPIVKIKKYEEEKYLVIDACESFDEDSKVLSFRFDYDFSGANDLYYNTFSGIQCKNKVLKDLTSKNIRVEVKDELGASTVLAL